MRRASRGGPSGSVRARRVATKAANGSSTSAHSPAAVSKLRQYDGPSHAASVRKIILKRSPLPRHRSRIPVKPVRSSAGAKFRVLTDANPPLLASVATPANTPATSSAPDDVAGGADSRSTIRDDDAPPMTTCVAGQLGSARASSFVVGILTSSSAPHGTRPPDAGNSTSGSFFAIAPPPGASGRELRPANGDRKNHACRKNAPADQPPAPAPVPSVPGPRPARAPALPPRRAPAAGARRGRCAPASPGPAPRITL